MANNLGKTYTGVVRQIPGLDDYYLDVPGKIFTDMGWDDNTKLMWVIEDDGTVVIRPPKYDNEPGEPVEFIDLLERTNKDDTSNKA